MLLCHDNDKNCENIPFDSADSDKKILGSLLATFKKLNLEKTDGRYIKAGMKWKGDL